ncbi:hypothetical protein ACFCV8_16555 [Streptomyces sp. NPDC056347]|uniref:hypothetical protein n=1 Tax=Streptomyces sp. NPDC056347 TaxID=3345790 RepID=UPI0035D5886B
MHSDTHLLLHRLRIAEPPLHAPEFPFVTPRPGLRTRLGWALVELGLRILPRPPVRPLTTSTAA